MWRYLEMLLFFAAVFFIGCRMMQPDIAAPRHSQPRTVPLKVTGYCKCGECCGWRRNWLFMPVIASGPNKGAHKKVGITASGTRARPGTVAADTSIFPFGTVLYVPGYGYGRVEDRGRDIKGHHIDLYFNSHSEAKEWGVQRKNVTVWPK